MYIQCIRMKLIRMMEKIIFLKILKKQLNSNYYYSQQRVLYHSRSPRRSPSVNLSWPTLATSQFVILISLVLSVLLVQSLVLVEALSSDSSDSGDVQSGHHNQNYNRNSKCPVGPIITILSREDSLYNNNNYNNKKKRHGVSGGGGGVVVVGGGGHLLLGASSSKFLAENHQGKIFSISYNENTTAISLSCWASSPITWNFEGPLGMIIRSTNISRISSGEDVRRNISSNFCYNAIINVAIQRIFTGTGNYSCSLLHQSSPIDSVYLYGNEKSSPSFLRPSGGGVLKASTNTNHHHKRNTLTLPCRANNPHVTTVLYLERGGEFHRVALDPSLKQQYKINYRAKSGFEVTGLGSNHIASLDGQKFKCEIINESTHSVLDSIIVTVVQDQIERKRSEELFIEFKDYRNCASFVCSPKGGSSLLKNGEKLEISFIKCENPMHCKLASTSVYNEIDFSKSNKDDCSDKRDIHVNGVSIQVDVDIEISGVILCRTTDKKYFQTLEYFKPPSSKDKITILKEDETINHHPTTTTSPSPLLIDVHNRTFYVNEEIDISCKASSFLFANGLQWLIQFKNGSIHQSTALSDSIVKSKAGVTQITSKMKMISEDVGNVICLAPHSSSSHWANVTYNVLVVDGTLPIIIEVSEPEVFYRVDDVNKSLICEATGLPMPTISWYKGGEPYEDKTQNSYPHFDTLTKENVTVSRLIFNKVAWNSSTIAGRYYCNATNAKGTAELRFITVDVKGSSAWKILTWFFGAFVVCIVVILTFYLHKFWRKSENQKEYIRKLNAREIDEFKHGRQPLPGIGGLQTIDDGREVAQYFPYNSQYEVNEEDLILEEDPENRKLGEGNYGIVVKGTLIRNGDRIPVAVKTLRSWNTMEAKTLLSELKILTYVGQHENVVSLEGAITNFEQSKIQVIIEYCAQRSLEVYLQQKRGVFVNEITNDQISFTEGSSEYVRFDYAIKTIDLIRWSYQFACGMRHLASRKIIHGDLAVRNLLLTETRDLKISDFGLSKKMANYSDNYYITSEKPNSEQGQPWRSLPPEYWMEFPRKLSTQTDAWAFGVTLWEIFSLADIPYEECVFGPSFTNSLVAGIRLHKPNYATSQIYAIMRKCWDEKPEKRPTFEDLAISFKDMLPGNYTTSMPLYRPLEITPMNFDYIYGDDLEQFQFQDC